MPVICTRRLLCLTGAIVLSLIGLSARSQTLVLLDSNLKARILTENTVMVRYKNVGSVPLIVSSAQLEQPSTHFTVGDGFGFDSLVAPGAIGEFMVFFQTLTPYEYDCTVLIASNDPLHPIVPQHIRVNDTIPPNPVVRLREYPMKNGYVRFAWDPPVPPRDGDSVWKYELLVGRWTWQADSAMGSTRDTQITAQPAGDGTLYYTIRTFDDAGNTADATDTGWSSRYPPQVGLVSIGSNSTYLTNEASVEMEEMSIRALSPRLSEMILWEKDTDAAAVPVKLADRWGNQPGGIYTFNWLTGDSISTKEIIEYTRDTVGAEATASWTFNIRQEGGWPQYIPKREVQPGATTITSDGIGPFLSTGCDIADGAFRFDGTVLYKFWPLDVTRPSEDFIVTSTADVDLTAPGYEMLVGNTNNQALLVGSDGRTITTLGQLQPESDILGMHETPFGKYVFVAGPSPVVIEDAKGAHSVGVLNEWNANGDSIQVQNLFRQSSVFEFDRYAAGSLLRNGSQQFVRVYCPDVITGEEIAVYNAEGKMLPGWPKPLWHPTTSYLGFYPSLGDIDGDGQLEIVIPTPNDSLHVFHADGSVVPGYPIYMNTHDAGHNQAILVDVNGDGAADIIIPANDSIQCINGLLHAPMRGMWPIRRPAAGRTLLTVAAVNQEGMLDLVEAPQVSDTGSWCNVFRLNVGNTPNTVQWGTFQHDMLRSGNFDAGVLSTGAGVSQAASAPYEPLEIVPQPASFHAQLVGDEISMANWQSIELYDMLGRLRLITSRKANAASEIDLRAIPSGSYSVIIRFKDSAVHTRLCVVK